MLVLTRKVNEAILVGQDIRIVVIGVDGDRVKIGIEAPRGVSVRRAAPPDHVGQSKPERP